MDYEKAYKESFGVAQCLHEAGDITTKKQMERLFPQLAESDDYRNWRQVRRAIRGFFTNPTESNKLLAWLEKQKEEQHVEYIDFDNEFENQVSHLLASILNGEHEYNEGFVKYAAQSLLEYAKNEMKPDEWVKREKLFTKAIQTANAQIGQLFEENKKLKEQKPAEINFKALLTADRLASAEMTGRLKERSEILENPEKYGLQKPAEWSEKDRHAIENCEYAIKETFKDEQNPHRIGTLDWLKNLSLDLKKRNEDAEKLYSNEWSEKDEIMIGSLINYFEGDALDCSTEDVVNWLKSLRPQSHWKPSEEQMSAFKGYIEDFQARAEAESGDGTTLM